MAAITRANLNTNVLQDWLQRTALETLEPNLFFAQFGQKPTAPMGYNKFGWHKFDQIATSAIASATDGVTPSDTDFDTTVIQASSTQYVAVVNFSDMLLNETVVDFLGGAINALVKAMARQIDTVIQTTVMAGTNVTYAGGKVARTALAATDKMTATLLNQANANLQNRDANTFDGGMYVAIIDPSQVRDLRDETATGAWIEANKYVTPDKIFRGEIGSLNGVRVVVSSNVTTFTSTVTVHPALVIGREAYGVADFQNIQAFITPAGPTDSDPAAQRRKVSIKTAFGVAITQQDALQRIETGASAL